MDNMRIVSPRVHVEIFRPTQVRLRKGPARDPVTGEFAKAPTIIDPNRFDTQHVPNEIRYIRISKNLESRRIKGIQFEETALFGGFIEINIAEDPQSEMFDKFLPNDHVEVFYNDTNEVTPDGDNTFIWGLNIQKDYKYWNNIPKFQGATWKTDLIYKPTYITTKLHAWDYLRILQYINIPKGERKDKYRATRVVAKADKDGTKLKSTIQRQKYGDDMLDYIDSAINSLTSYKDEVSIFGQETAPPEVKGDTKAFGLKFTKSSTESKSPIINFTYTGIGTHVYNKVTSTTPYIFYNKIESIKKNAYNDNKGKPIEDSETVIFEDIKKEISDMDGYDIKMFRFLDGKFARFAGLDGNKDPILKTDVEHYVADVIAISQFALIEIILKKITLDHGLNQWFTPIIRYAPGFLKNIEDRGKLIGKKISKLIYIRLRTVGTNNEESTIFAFNADTYGFVADFAQDAHRLAIGNLYRTLKKEASGAETDIFSEIFMTTPFPQPAPNIVDGEEQPLSVIALVDDIQGKTVLFTKIKTHRELYDDLMEKFTIDYTSNDTLEDNDIGVFYDTLMKRSSAYARFMQKTLATDDKLISFIKGVPASYMRADIYTGSKFNTVQYDSLAITRLIQLITASMAGFPVSNNPKTNTEKGKIDSYPIFSANRMVIRPKVYFGIREKKFEDGDEEWFYELYQSLTELFIKRKYDKQGLATCFLFLDVAQKELKGAGETPDFIFPMEDIQDFGMIKASTVNHMFNFSIADQMKDFTAFKDIGGLGKFPDKDEQIIFENVATNGIFIEYVEGGLTSFGFSPPEHQHLKLEDLTQNREYTPWGNRYASSPNINFSEKLSRPVYNPKRLYIKITKDKKGDKFFINNFNNWKLPSLAYLFREESKGDSKTKTAGWLKYVTENSPSITDPNVADKHSDYESLPFQGITGYIDITDIKNEFKALELILTNEDLSYKDISNVDQELMDNIRIRIPMTFKFNETDGTKYKDRIKLVRPTNSEGRVTGEKTTNGLPLSIVIKDINTQLNKIGETEMLWLFPYSGWEINAQGEQIEIQLDKNSYSVSNTYKKHLLLLIYLDLLVKGIRYILWSLAKSRFFAHVYLPIEYKKYAKTPPDGINYAADIVEPGSSVRITYNKDNSLFKSVGGVGVAFPIHGLSDADDAYLPLYRTVSYGNELIDDVDGIPTLTTTDKSKRVMTWYVSKKVTYLGADGAMMRVEMTEGSLDWTLFYNEKNLLTQVSEHYLLNGLGNFRTGIF